MIGKLFEAGGIVMLPLLLCSVLALIGYGNATQPGSPHTVEQLQLFANKQLRPVWRDRQEILAHLEERKVF